MINSAPLNSVPLNSNGTVQPSGGGFIPLGTGTMPTPPAPQTDSTTYSAFFNQSDSENWTLVIRVNGSDIGEALIDKSPVIVEAERNAARIAEFTVKLSGTVDVLSWTGRTVTIDYKTQLGDEWRFFSGVIIDPQLDLSDMTLRCQCSDDAQVKIDAMDNASLQALTGGLWHKSTFSETNKGWSRLQDLLSTVPYSAEFDANGVLRLHAWQPAATPNFTFDDSFLKEELRVDLVKRLSVINRIDLAFSVRFERLYHRVEKLTWDTSLTVCEVIARSTNLMRNAMVVDAVKSANRRMLNVFYIPAWPSGIYTCGGSGAAFNNLAPSQLCIGFVANTAFRWSQSVTQTFALVITVPDSIAAYGELKSSTETSTEYKTQVEDWGGDKEDFAVLPAGFKYDVDGNQFRDEVDQADLTAALNCRIAYEVETKINRSHRTNKVGFKIPVIRDLGLQHTVVVSDGNLSCKGVVSKLRYEFDLATARAEIAGELTLSSGHSGVESVNQTWTLPSLPDISVNDPFYIERTVPNNVGGTFSTPAYDPAMWGFFVNWRAWVGAIPDPLIMYDEKLELKFDGIDDAKTQNLELNSAATIAIDVAHNPLTITA